MFRIRNITMKSIERDFKRISEGNPYWSSYVCFVEAIRGRKYNKRIIIRWFNKLVDKDDYDKEEKNDIIADLVNL